MATADLGYYQTPYASPNPVTAGNTVSINVNIGNYGNTTAASSTTKVQIKPQGSTTTITQNTFSTPSILPNNYVAQSFQLTIPSGTQAGTYTAWIILDNNNTAGQTNYSNDQTNFNFSVTSPITTYTLSIASSNPNSGVYVYVGPNDNQGLADGTTSFSRQFNAGTSVTLIAPTTAGGNNFVKWTRNSVDYDVNRTTSLTMSTGYTMTAVFAPAPPVTHTITVASSSPNSGVSISSNTLDNNSNAGGATTFNRIFNHNATATYVAPATAGGNNFQKWQRDGVDFTTSTTASVTVDANHTLTVIYTSPPPAPVLSNISPTSVVAGTGTKTTFTLNGSNFASQTIVQVMYHDSNGGWVQTSSAPTYVNATQLTVQIGVGTYAPDTWHVRVVNPDGQPSNEVTFQVTTAAPTTYTLSIASSNPSSGAHITVGPNDKQGLADGSTPFSRQYDGGTSVTLIADPTAGGNNFTKWTRNGADFSVDRTINFTLSGNDTFTAVFAPAPPVTHTITVASSNPNSGVSIGSSTLDNNSNAGGITTFTRIFNHNANATYVAPATASGNNFQKWQRDGVDFTTSTTVSTTVDANHTLTAVYTSLPSAPVLSSVSPSSVIGSSNLQTFTITGSNFTGQCIVQVGYRDINYNFADLSGTHFIDPQHLSVQIKTGIDADTWKVRIRNGSLYSGEGSFAVTAPAAGQIYSLNGFAYDSQTSQPIAGVLVSLGGPSTTTDSSGHYSFTALSNTTYSLSATKAGYSDYLASVNPAGSASKNLYLAPNANTASPGVLSGYVRDATTGGALANVVVNLNNGAQRTTDGTGAFTFGSLPAGYYTVSVSLSNYLGYNQSVHINGDVNLPVQLTKTTASLGTKTPSGYGADPVNTATGNYVYEHTDLRMPAKGIPFVLERNYNAQDSPDGPFGFGWSHTYNPTLSADSAGNITFRGSDGKTATFAPNAQGGFTPQYGVFDTLVTNANGTHSLIKKEQTLYNFDASNRLTSIVDKNGNTVPLTYTGSNLTRVTDTAGRNIDLTYDGNNHITQITDPIGRTLKYTYDASGNLIAATDKNGNVTQYLYDGSHHLLSVTDPRGNKLVSNVYDANGRVVVSQKDAKNGETTYSYDFTSRKTVVSQPLGHTTTDYHDELQRLVRQDDSLGNTTRYSYDTAGNRTAVIDRNGNNTLYGYDASGNVTSKTDALSNVTLITYDAKNNPLTRTDALNQKTSFAYDGNGNLTSITDPLGSTTSITYDASGLPLTTTDARGKTTTSTYDGAGNVLQVTDPVGNKTIFTYDGAGRKLTAKDALNHVTTIVYDNNDNLLSATDPLGKSIVSTYDGNDNKTSTKDKRGNSTTFAYDVKDLLTTATDPAGGVVPNAYDALDRKISVTDARGGVTQYGYDTEGNLLRVTDALGKVMTCEYDANGNRTSVTNPLGQKTVTAYDQLNRVVSVTDPLGNATTTIYDAAGRRTRTTDALGRNTDFAYDAAGRLTGVKDANGGTVVYGYDAAGNRTSVTDPNSHATTYTYDAGNRLVGKLEPSGGTYQYAYDGVGNRTSATDAKGQTIAYSYDANNRLATVTYPAGTPVTFSYDENGNRTQMVDGVGTSSYAYDVLNRMTSSTDGYGKIVGYGYDANGNRLSMTYPGNKTVAYAYDADNRLASVTDWLTHVTTYSYDDAGNLAGTANPNGTTAAYGYDPAGRLTSLANAKVDASVICNYSLTLDAVGNHTKSTQNEPLVPNLASQTVNYTYDNDNRLTAAGGTSCTYDSNGNLITKGADTFNYDFENRLAQDSVGGATSQYQYDGVGNRKSAVTPAGTKRFVLDTNGSLSHVLAETDGGGAVNAFYIYGRGLISRIAADGTPRYYHYDVRGSTIALSDSSGNLTDEYAYDPFGKIANTQGATTNPFKYVGRYGVMDEGNGLDYIRARYFSPEIGRFVTKDPTTGTDGDSQSLHRYVYAQNNPIRLVDISGFSPREVTSTFHLPTSDPSVAHNYLLGPINVARPLSTVTAGSTPSWLTMSGTYPASLGSEIVTGLRSPRAQGIAEIYAGGLGIVGGAIAAAPGWALIGTGIVTIPAGGAGFGLIAAGGFEAAPGTLAVVAGSATLWHGLGELRRSFNGKDNPFDNARNDMFSALDGILNY